MKKITKAKKYLAGSLLMMSLVLSSCRNQTNELPKQTEITEEENQAQERISYTIAEGYLSIRKSLREEKPLTEEIYTKINTGLEENPINSLFLEHLGDTVDLSKLDLKNINIIEINRPLASFNYKPLYNNEVKVLDLTINANANTESTLEYLKNLKTNGTSIILSFTDEITSDIQNKYIKVIGELPNVSGLSLNTSNIESLDLTPIKSYSLTLTNGTPETEIKHTLDINKNVNFLTIMSSFPDDYEGIPILKEITINTPNKNIVTNIIITKGFDNSFRSTMTEESIINIDTENIVHISGIDYHRMQKEDFKFLENLSHVLMTNIADDDTFIYNADEMIIDEALNQIRNTVNKTLELK